MNGLLFEHRHLRNYKKWLAQQLTGQEKTNTPPPPELEKSYIPLTLLKHYFLYQNYQGVCKRKPWPLTKIVAGEKIWVVGKPGAGKTTFLRKLALMLARGKLDSGKIPVYIYLKNLAQTKQGLLENIIHIFESGGYSNPLKFIKKRLQEGKLVLLLDGLDEIATPALTQKVLAKINRFLSEHGKYSNALLIACRSIQHCQVLDGIGQASLSELDQQEIEKHVESKSGGPVNPAKLLKALNGDIRLKRLARTPLGVSGICSLYQNQKKLPTVWVPRNRAEFYQAYVRHALESPKLFSPQHKLQVLGELAFACHNQRRIHFTEAEFCQLAQKAISPARVTKDKTSALLAEILNTSDLITTYNAIAAYRFSHLSLQEFLTAQKIAGLPNGIRFILSKHRDGWWTECIAFYAGLLNNPSGIIISLNEVNRELALKCFAEAKQVYPDLQEIMQQLLRQMVCNLAETLHLSDFSPAIVHKADSETIRLLKDILGNSPNLGLKVRCAQVLYEIGDEQSLKIIQDELKNGNDIETKRCTALGLDRLWSNPQSLLQALQAADKQLLHLAQKELRTIETRN